ncbi:hypothetical protein H696_01328 [Fonticula alba]|uniref:E3 ubiquitin-protein ligase APD1-4 middle domain-containing protein n=1 Tax=Fonticula alba TaxID=691883 RepID=A0A058ZDB1_FONAL|nr:hypothetical protein H696_01328 [Fonticula alba]KCV71918.1 hypothetical protein H696_01328 [Fonticula alba]|eukprot:XP_009493496.1 hypothetical protein H696_01328 [Fonticula alba]
MSHNASLMTGPAGNKVITAVTYNSVNSLPPASSAPYPPVSSTPYPPASSTPYPPASSAPYPPAGGTPRPASGAYYSAPSVGQASAQYANPMTPTSSNVSQAIDISRQIEAQKRQTHQRKWMATIGLMLFFLMCIGLCFIFVPIPGGKKIYVPMGSQVLHDRLNGQFIHSLWLHGIERPDQQEVDGYLFPEEPQLTTTRAYSLTHFYRLPAYTHQAFDVFLAAGSHINLSVTNNSQTSAVVYLIRGEAAYHRWVTSRTLVEAEVIPVPGGSHITQRLAIPESDDYYIVFYNEGGIDMVSSAEMKADVVARVYDLAQAKASCTGPRCFMLLEYGTRPYLVLQTPPRQGGGFTVNVDQQAHAWAYGLLYGSLIVGMAASVLASRAYIVHQGKLRCAELDELRRPLIDSSTTGGGLLGRTHRP